MQSITLHSRVGSDGILHLEVPVGVTDTELEVTLERAFSILCCWLG